MFGILTRARQSAVKQGGTADRIVFVLDRKRNSVGGVFCCPDRRQSILQGGKNDGIADKTMAPPGVRGKLAGASIIFHKMIGGYYHVV